MKSHCEQDRSEVIRATTVELLRRAATRLPSDVKDALRCAYETEKSEVARMNLRAILDNIELAEKRAVPMCQDTGMIIFYVTNPMKVCEQALIEGTREATRLVPLRPNAVHPLSRKNSGDNTGHRTPAIHYRSNDAEHMELTVLPKGAGSENMSRLAMLTPANGLKGIKEFALNTILEAGGKPCPPLVVGVGIGGSADLSMELAKEALLRPLPKPHKEKEIAVLEKELCDAFNATGIGPMGLGGDTTCLGVKVEYAHCHTASLPVAVNIQCWAARRASARLSVRAGDKLCVEYME